MKLLRSKSDKDLLHRFVEDKDEDDSSPDESTKRPPMIKRNSSNNLAVLVSDLSPKSTEGESPKIVRRKSHSNLTSLLKNKFITKVFTSTKEVSTSDEEAEDTESKVEAILERQKKTQTLNADPRKLNRRSSSRNLLTEEVSDDRLGVDEDKRMDRSRRGLSRAKVQDAAMVRTQSRNRQGDLSRSPSERQLDGFRNRQGDLSRSPSGRQLDGHRNRQGGLSRSPSGRQLQHRNRRSSRTRLDEPSRSPSNAVLEGRTRGSPRSTLDKRRRSPLKVQSGDSDCSRRRNPANDADQVKTFLNRHRERSSRSLNKQGSIKSLSGIGSLEDVSSKSSRRKKALPKDEAVRSSRSLAGLGLLDEGQNKNLKEEDSSNNETAPTTEITFSVIDDISFIDLHIGDDDEIPRTKTVSNVWLCTCGEETEINYKHCGMCGNKRHWTCGVCAFEKNIGKFKFCGECGTTKQEQELRSSHASIHQEGEPAMHIPSSEEAAAIYAVYLANTARAPNLIN